MSTVTYSLGKLDLTLFVGVRMILRVTLNVEGLCLTRAVKTRPCIDARTLAGMITARSPDVCESGLLSLDCAPNPPVRRKTNGQIFLNGEVVAEWRDENHQGSLPLAVSSIDAMLSIDEPDPVRLYPGDEKAEATPA